MPKRGRYPAPGLPRRRYSCRHWLVCCRRSLGLGKLHTMHAMPPGTWYCSRDDIDQGPNLECHVEADRRPGDGERDKSSWPDCHRWDPLLYRGGVRLIIATMPVLVRRLTNEVVLQRSHEHVGPRMLCGHKSSSSEHWQQLGTAMVDYLLLRPRAPLAIKECLLWPLWPRMIPYGAGTKPCPLLPRFRREVQGKFASTCKTGMPEADLPPEALFLEAEGNQ